MNCPPGLSAGRPTETSDSRSSKLDSYPTAGTSSLVSLLPLWSPAVCVNPSHRTTSFRLESEVLIPLFSGFACPQGKGQSPYTMACEAAHYLAPSSYWLIFYHSLLPSLYPSCTDLFWLFSNMPKTRLPCLECTSSGCLNCHVSLHLQSLSKVTFWETSSLTTFAGMWPPSLYFSSLL